MAVSYSNVNINGPLSCWNAYWSSFCYNQFSGIHEYWNRWGSYLYPFQYFDPRYFQLMPSLNSVYDNHNHANMVNEGFQFMSSPHPISNINADRVNEDFRLMPPQHSTSDINHSNKKSKNSSVSESISDENNRHHCYDNNRNDPKNQITNHSHHQNQSTSPSRTKHRFQSCSRNHQHFRSRSKTRKDFRSCSRTRRHSRSCSRTKHPYRNSDRKTVINSNLTCMLEQPCRKNSHVLETQNQHHKSELKAMPSSQSEEQPSSCYNQPIKFSIKSSKLIQNHVMEQLDKRVAEKNQTDNNMRKQNIVDASSTKNIKRPCSFAKAIIRGIHYCEACALGYDDKKSFEAHCRGTWHHLKVGICEPASKFTVNKSLLKWNSRRRSLLVTNQFFSTDNIATAGGTPQEHAVVPSENILQSAVEALVLLSKEKKEDSVNYRPNNNHLSQEGKLNIVHGRMAKQNCIAKLKETNYSKSQKKILKTKYSTDCVGNSLKINTCHNETKFNKKAEDTSKKNGKDGYKTKHVKFADLVDLAPNLGFRKKGAMSRILNLSNYSPRDHALNPLIDKLPPQAILTRQNLSVTFEQCEAIQNRNLI